LCSECWTLGSAKFIFLSKRAFCYKIFSKSLFLLTKLRDFMEGPTPKEDFEAIFWVEAKCCGDEGDTSS